jgi:hypothetical protein
MPPTFLTLTLLAFTLAFGLTAPWGERLACAALAQVPAPAERAPPGQAAPPVTPSRSGRQKIFSLPHGAHQPPQWAADGHSLFVNNFFSLLQIDLAGRELARPPFALLPGRAR